MSSGFRWICGFEDEKFSGDDLTRAMVEERRSNCALKSEVSELPDKRQMGKSTVGRLPGGNGDTEWCAELELRVDLAQAAHPIGHQANILGAAQQPSFDGCGRHVFGQAGELGF